MNQRHFLTHCLGPHKHTKPQKGSFCWLLLFKKGVTIENAYMRFLMKFCCVNIAHFVIYVLWKCTSVASWNINFHFRMTSNQTLCKCYSKRKTHKTCWVCIKFLMVVNNLVKPSGLLFSILFSSGVFFFHFHSILDKRSLSFFLLPFYTWDCSDSVWIISQDYFSLTLS